MFVCCLFVCLPSDQSLSAISQRQGGRVSLEKKKTDEKIIDITNIINASITKCDLKSVKLTSFISNSVPHSDTRW